MRVGQTCRRDAEKFLDKAGFVVQRLDGTACPPTVGESENDPFLVVQFPNGDRDGFWTEELIPIDIRRS